MSSKTGSRCSDTPTQRLGHIGTAPQFSPNQPLGIFGRSGSSAPEPELGEGGSAATSWNVVYLPLGMIVMRSTDLCTGVLLVVAALALPVNMYQDTGYRVSRPW